MGEGALRQVEEFLVTEDEWKHFLDTHSSINCLVQESNEKMRNSYDYMRFLDNSNGRKDPSKSILGVGAKAALDNSGFDEEMFVKSGGRYKWSKAQRQISYWNGEAAVSMVVLTGDWRTDCNLIF